MDARIIRHSWKIPLLVIAWLLHGLSEWSYSAASWLYRKCGTDMIEANIQWETPDDQ